MPTSDAPYPKTADGARHPSDRPALSARYALVFLLAVEIAVFWVLAPEKFGTIENLQTTLLSESVLGILTLGVLVSLIVGEFDVSLAMVFTLAMLVAAILMSQQGWSPGAAFGAAVVLSGGVGALTGILVVATGANSLIVSLGMMIVLRGVAEALTQGSTVRVSGESGQVLRDLSTAFAWGTGPVLALVFVALVVWFITEQTPLGRKLHAVGGSGEGARLLGLQTDVLRIGAFAGGGLLAGVAGVLQLSESVTATASFGSGFLFPAIAAAFLGAVAFRIGTFNVRGALIAIFVLSVGVTGIKMLGAPKWIDGIFYGAALVAAVAVVQAVAGRKK